MPRTEQLDALECQTDEFQGNTFWKQSDIVRVNRSQLSHYEEVRIGFADDNAPVNVINQSKKGD